MRARKPLALLTCLTLATTGCASIIGGEHTRLRVDIEGPSDGVVTLVEGVTNDDAFEQTENSFVVALKHGSDYVVRVKAPDRPDQTIRIGRYLNPAYFLNAIWLIPAGFVTYLMATETNIGAVGAVILYLTSLATTPLGIGGMVIDSASDAMWAHNRNHLTIKVK